MFLAFSVRFRDEKGNTLFLWICSRAVERGLRLTHGILHGLEASSLIGQVLLSGHRESLSLAHGALHGLETSSIMVKFCFLVTMNV